MAVDRLLRVLPALRHDGWILTPFNTSVTAGGVVMLRVRAGDEEIGDELARRIRVLDPTLVVQVAISGSRHVIFRQ